MKMQLVELFVAIELGLIYGLVAVSIYLAFEVLKFPDLTCDGSFALGGVMVVQCFNHGLGTGLSLFLASSAGVLSGVGTALLACYCKMSDLLSGIIVAFILYSINMRIMGGLPNISVINGDGFFDGDGAALKIFLIIFAVICFIALFMKTDLGLGLMSLGQGQSLAMAMGINIKLFTVLGLGISNGLVALGGGLFSLNQSFSDVSQGLGTLIFGLAAITIGDALFAFNSLLGKLLGCIFGSVVYRVVVAMAINSDFVGVNPQDLNLITGAVVVLVILLRKRENGSVLREN